MAEISQSLVALRTGFAGFSIRTNVFVRGSFPFLAEFVVFWSLDCPFEVCHTGPKQLQEGPERRLLATA